MAHPDSGFYEKDGLEYVSVSTVLGETVDLFNPGKEIGVSRWRNNEEDWEEILADAQQRGKIIHYELETAYGIKPRDTEDWGMDDLIRLKVPDYITQAADMIEHLSHCNNIVEEELFSPLGYAGTPDNMCGITEDVAAKLQDFAPRRSSQIMPVNTVVDYKSVYPPKPDQDPKPRSRSYYAEAFQQEGGYALAHNQLVKKGELLAEPVEQGLVIVLYSWRQPQIHVLTKEQIKQSALKFTERFKAYCLLQGETFPRPKQ